MQEIGRSNSLRYCAGLLHLLSAVHEAITQITQKMLHSEAGIAWARDAGCADLRSNRG